MSDTLEGQTYFFVDAHKVNEHDTKTRFEQTVLTRKHSLKEQHEAIWLHVYRALQPDVGDQLVITCLEQIKAPESADG